MTDDVTSPRRHGYFFGWRLVAALFFSTFAMYGVNIYSFIIFTMPLSERFAWGAAETGNLVSAMWLVAPLSLVMVPIISRFGVWRMIFFGLVVQAVAILSLDFLTAYWQLYLVRMAMGVGKIAIMVSLPVIVSEWFDRHFGVAMAFAWAGGYAGGFFLSPLTEYLLSNFGLRTATFVLALAVMLLVLGISACRSGFAVPADLGLGKDGDVLGAAHAAKDGEGRQEEPAEPISVRRFAGFVKIPVTAIMVVGVIGIGMSAIGFQSQQPAFLQLEGFSRASAAMMLGVTSGACLLGAVAVGWAIDRFNIVWSCLGVGLCLLAGLLCFAFAAGRAPNLSLAIIGSLCVGLTFGGGESLFINLFKRQFGPALFATAYSVFYLALQAGYGSGGFLGGYALQTWHASGFLVICGLLYAPALTIAFFRPQALRQVRPQALRQESPK